MSANIEAFKEIIRLVVFAVIGVIITTLLNYVVQLPETTTTIILAGVLRYADKYVHENKNIGAKGIIPF